MADRTQFYNPITKRWNKRNTETGEIMNVMSLEEKTFERVKIESKPAVKTPKSKKK